jgi:hypothetical protein
MRYQVLIGAMHLTPDFPVNKFFYKSNMITGIMVVNKVVFILHTVRKATLQQGIAGLGDYGCTVSKNWAAEAQERIQEGYETPAIRYTRD